MNNKAKTTYFKDNIEIKFTDKKLEVFHSHWLLKKSNISVKWNDISYIHSVQIEPFDLCLLIIDTSGAEYQLDENMIGWDDVMKYIKQNFVDFDWNSLEKAKQHINQPFLCWQSKP